MRVSANGGEPTFRRRFLERETGEIRIYAGGGDDRLTSHGTGAGGIQVRFVGGPGDDTVDDSAGRPHALLRPPGPEPAARGAGHQGEQQALRTSQGPPRVQAHRLGLADDLDAPGSARAATSACCSGAGGVDGLRVPQTSLGVAATAQRGLRVRRAGLARGIRRPVAAHELTQARGPASRAPRTSSMVRFYGFGNETAAEQPEDFFRTQQRQFLLQPSFRFGLDKVELWIGARGKYQHTDEDPSTFVGLTQPYGVGDFGQVGANLRFEVDGRNRPEAATTRRAPSAWRATTTRRRGTSKSSSARRTASWACTSTSCTCASGARRSGGATRSTRRRSSAARTRCAAWPPALRGRRGRVRQRGAALPSVPVQPPRAGPLRAAGAGRHRPRLPRGRDLGPVAQGLRRRGLDDVPEAPEHDQHHRRQGSGRRRARRPAGACTSRRASRSRVEERMYRLRRLLRWSSAPEYSRATDTSVAPR